MKSEVIVNIMWALPAGCVERLGAKYLGQLLKKDYEEVMHIINEKLKPGKSSVPGDYALLKSKIKEVCDAGN